MNIRLKNKILIVTTVWQRPELTDIVLYYFGKMAARSKGQIQLLAAGSEGAESMKMCHRNGWSYIERPNLPVSCKWAAVVKEASYLDFDFLVIVGSDDLLSLPLIQFYDKYYSRDSDFMLGLGDLYFYMMASAKSYHFHGYPTLQTIGAGRCISRKILEQINWAPWGQHQLNRGLDHCCSTILRTHWVPEKSVKMKDTGGVGIDIKHQSVAISDEARIIEKSSFSENILKRDFLAEYKAICKIKNNSLVLQP